MNEVVKDSVTVSSGINSTCSTNTDIHTTSKNQSQPFDSSRVEVKESSFGAVDQAHLESGIITQTPRSACQLNGLT